MKVCIVGLGYVGVVTAACLAKEGFDVIGVDVSKEKVDSLNRGESPIVEEGLDELVAGGVEKQSLRATTCLCEGLTDAEIVMICVGTPSKRSGELDDRYVLSVTKEVGELLAGRCQRVLLVYRSTMVPGTMRNAVQPALERYSGLVAGAAWDVVFHPEFLREGSSIKDFYNPPKIVVGCDRVTSAESVLALYGEHIAAPRIVCGVEVAETVKYCDNLFHAVKVTFANEIGQVCHALNISSSEVMDIFCQDRKLNISEKYLRPGFAFGGSCLPKDLRAFLALSRQHELSLPMLEGVLPSNRSQIERVLHTVIDSGARKIGFCGLAFKEGTDDLRESPYVALAELLIGKGFQLSVYDPHVHWARLMGANRAYIESRFPHLAGLLVESWQELLSAELILLCHRPADEVISALKAAGRDMLDLTGVSMKPLDGVTRIV